MQAVKRYEAHEISEIPPAFPPIQMVRTCGTVMTIVTTDRSLRIFSKPPIDAGLGGGSIAAQSGGSIAIISFP
jgi:hypothetical protein